MRPRQTMQALVLAFVSLLTANVYSEEWRVVFEDHFDRPTLGDAWVQAEKTLKGGAVTGGRQIPVLKKTYRAPAIRVTYDAWAESDKWSDQSVTIGKVFFGFASDNNTVCKIAAPGQLEIRNSFPPSLKGRKYRVVAEINGRIATLRVDGQPVIQARLARPFQPGPIKLYVLSGGGRFDNLKVFTKTTADPEESVVVDVVEDQTKLLKESVLPNPTLLEQEGGKLKGWYMYAKPGKIAIEEDSTVRFMGRPTTKVTVTPAKEKAEWQIGMNLPLDTVRGKRLTFTAYARTTEDAKPRLRFRVRNYDGNKHYGDTPSGPLKFSGTKWRKTTFDARVPADDAVKTLNTVFEGHTEKPFTIWITGLALNATDEGKPRMHYWSPEDMELTNRPASVEMQRVPLTVRSPIDITVPYPLTFGVPLPKDQVWRTQDIRLTDASGKEIDAQIQPTATWQQAGSLRWVLVDAQPDSIKGDSSLFLEYGRKVSRNGGAGPMSVKEADDAITVDTGPLRVRFSKTRGSLIDAAWLNGRSVLKSHASSGAYFIDNTGAEYQSNTANKEYEVVVETHGPWRTVVRAEGLYENSDGRNSCIFVHRVWLYRNQPFVKIATTWMNTENTDKKWFKDIGTRLSLTEGQAETVRFGTKVGVTASAFEETEEERLKASLQFTAPAAIIQKKLRSFEIEQNDKVVTNGKKAGGWVATRGPAGSVFLAVRDMAMQFPNSLEVRKGRDVSPDSLVFHAFSDKAGFEMDFRLSNLKKIWGEEVCDRFQKGRGNRPPLEKRISNGQGFARTHEMLLAFGDAEMSVHRYAVQALDPPHAFPNPEFACSTLAFGPCAAKNTRRFPEHEKFLSESFDFYHRMVTHLNPYIGFWDYGRGMPHYWEERKAEDAEQEWIFSGYRANYDLGYGNPIAPWLFYVRSGERKYLDWAKAMNQQAMDARTIHWAEQPLKRQRGMHYGEVTTWTWDGHNCHFEDTMWYKFLALEYYITGNPRAIDVYGMVIDEYMKYMKDRALSPYWTKSVKMGNLAIWYRHTWDARVRKEIGKHVKYWNGRLRPNGMAPNRQAWVDYGLFEALQIPDPDPLWIDTGEKYAMSATGIHRDAGPWKEWPTIQWWHYQRTKEPWHIYNAKDYLKNPKSFEFKGGSVRTSLGTFRVPMVYMTLAGEPGAEKVVPFKTAYYTRGYRRPFFLKHEKGRPVEIIIAVKFGTLMITAPDGKQLTAPQLITDKAGILRLSLGDNDPEGIYRIKLDAVEVTQMGKMIRGRQARIEPWNPHLVTLKFKYTNPPKLVQEIPDGALTASPEAYFFVPEGTKDFRLRVQKWYDYQVIYLRKPDGSVTEQKGYELVVKPAPAETGKVWGVRVKEAYEPFGLYKPFFLKLYGVPPYVAHHPDSVFNPNPNLKTTPDRQWDTNTRYPDGRFGKSVSIIGEKGHVDIPLGKKLDRPGARERFDMGKGTIEFFVRLPRSTSAGGFGKELILLRCEGYASCFIMFLHKNAYGFLSENSKWLYRYVSGQQICEAYIWHHVAHMWNTNDNGKTMIRFYLDGYPFPQFDPPGSMERRHNWLPAMKPIEPFDVMHLGGDYKNADLPAHMDELRISDIPRYPYHQGFPLRPGGSKAFDPPTEPFRVDEHTLALFHFDGSVEGVDNNGKPIKAAYRGSLGER